jgi:hypothetical protein
LGATPCAIEIHVDYGIPPVARQLLGAGDTRDPGVVDQRVDRAKGRFDQSGSSFD